MKKTNVFKYYAFGYDYGLIRNDGLYSYDMKKAIDMLESFFDSTEELGLEVTKKACDDLKEILKELKESKEKKVDGELSGRIQTEIDRIDIVLDAELKLKEAFELTDKRYSLDKLLYNPKKLLAKDVFDGLNDHTKRDFHLACGQIALTLPTGVAFHLMRALEEQVKELYCHFKKKNRMNKPMWGPMIKELRNKRNPKPSEKLLDLLDSIRIHYRNPTQHSDLFYTIDEAQDLLNQTISAINLINSEI
ncbi:MAG: hypothetical protein KDC52_14710 [Ignavibacteriae bacterium]|nr:hypothetical protein [Bdellovibrionales bacterium]MCB0748111.1 hypothetical protein [Ignavibacteriota bacterium]MCB0752720.1 hypothetical protein [Ignavibacteriota bacterium]